MLVRKTMAQSNAKYAKYGIVWLRILFVFVEAPLTYNKCKQKNYSRFEMNELVANARDRRNAYYFCDPAT